MKISAQEEYGLRILIRIAGHRHGIDGISIPQLSGAEGLGNAYVAKLCRVLRLAGYIYSTPGSKGGYILARPAQEIYINDILEVLGGRLFDAAHCGTPQGTMRFCANSVDCSVRSLWQMMQLAMDVVLKKITLHDLLAGESSAAEKLQANMAGIIS